MLRSWIIVAAVFVMAAPSIAQERRSKIGLDEDIGLEEGLVLDNAMESDRRAAPAGRPQRLRPDKLGKHRFEPSRQGTLKPLYGQTNALSAKRDPYPRADRKAPPRAVEGQRGPRLPNGWPSLE
ncbi:hypothetical protein [Azospirillum sp. SYSU D00513]|uniref:hypothetical protein n=1 Tax=Azospirillum sp. SYSU D00513 TaxID=2812561 RepID=UPI001A97A24B|nr:hypothetical protein [Azospirillum sp. SYSU D00513]